MATFGIRINGTTELTCAMPEDDLDSARARLVKALSDGETFELKVDDAWSVVVNGGNVVTLEVRGPMPGTIAMH